jgi:hypothetical protein
MPDAEKSVLQVDGFEMGIIESSSARLLKFSHQPDSEEQYLANEQFD